MKLPQTSRLVHFIIIKQKLFAAKTGNKISNTNELHALIYALGCGLVMCKGAALDWSWLWW
jgi:hypothetical protein